MFRPMRIAGAFVIEAERFEDDRGYFARTWCRREFSEKGLSAELAQISLSVNRRAGTLRGMHMQAPPHQESKLVRCARGAIYDVVLDLRRESETFLQWQAVEVTADNGCMVYLPDGCAHGFQTLTDDSEVVYHISEFYDPQSARGFRWNDPAFGITWPLTPSVMSTADRNHADFVR